MNPYRDDSLVWRKQCEELEEDLSRVRWTLSCVKYDLLTYALFTLLLVVYAGLSGYMAGSAASLRRATPPQKRVAVIRPVTADQLIREIKEVTALVDMYSNALPSSPSWKSAPPR